MKGVADVMIGELVDQGLKVRWISPLAKACRRVQKPKSMRKVPYEGDCPMDSTRSYWCYDEYILLSHGHVSHDNLVLWLWEAMAK
jgi:hypothetical protein